MEPQNVVKKSEFVKLNVGGKRYITTRSTLSEHGENFFTRILERVDSGKIMHETDEKGYILIDRNGKLFEYVLDYLRSGTLICSKKMELRKRVRKELEFYEMGRPLDFVKLRKKTGEKLDKSTLVIENSIRRAMEKGEITWVLIHSRDNYDPSGYDDPMPDRFRFKPIECLITPEGETVDIDIRAVEASIYVFRDEFEKRWGINCSASAQVLSFDLKQLIYG